VQNPPRSWKPSWPARQAILTGPPGRPDRSASLNAIAGELAASGDGSTAQSIKDAIERASHEKPLDVDVARVRARLAAGGWPLATADHLAALDHTAG
jgi:hypothetical protein